MDPRFVSTENLAAVRLDETAPLGLFRAMEGGQSALFLVADLDGVRHGIILEGFDERFQFCSFPLNERSHRWAGIALGPVELLVDTESSRFVTFGLGGRGVITIKDGGAYLNTSDEQGYGLFSFHVGVSAESNCASALVFGSWRLVQRDHIGNPITLFSMTNEQAA